MAKEGPLDFNGTEWGSPEFRSRGSLQLHVHRKSPLDLLIDASENDQHVCMFRLGGEQWEEIHIHPFARRYFEPSVYADGIGSWEVDLHTSDIVRARGFVLGFLARYPCPEPDEFLKQISPDMDILYVPKGKRSRSCSRSVRVI